MMQEWKKNQKELSNTLKLEVQNGIRETMQALSLSANQKNINPNPWLIPRGMFSWAGYGNQYMQLPEQPSEDIAPFQKNWGYRK